jgi:hypothetical protein
MLKTLARKLRRLPLHRKKQSPHLTLHRNRHPCHRYQPIHFTVARHQCRARSESYRTMKNLPSAPLWHDDSRHRARSLYIDPLETRILARAVSRMPCEDALVKRKGLPFSAEPHRIDHRYLVLYVDRTACRTVVKRINVRVKAACAIRVLPSSYSPGLPPTTLPLL